MEKHFVSTVTYGTALYPGKSVLVTDISRDYPVPDFVLSSCEPSSSPAPLNAFQVNAREFVEAHRLPAPLPPDRKLKNEELWKKYRWTRDAEMFELATSQYEFPKPIAFNTSNDLLSHQVSYYVWSESATDAWHAKMRAKATEIQKFLK